MKELESNQPIEEEIKAPLPPQKIEDVPKTFVSRQQRRAYERAQAKLAKSREKIAERVKKIAKRKASAQNLTSSNHEKIL